MEDTVSSKRIRYALWLALALVAIVGGMLLWIGSHIKLDTLETILPTIVIVGVFALLVSLAIIAIALSVLGLSDKTQALALPSGSVRAVIALMLVLLFAIISIFLYDTMGGSVKTALNLTQAERDKLASVKNITILSAEKSPTSDTFTVLYERQESAAAQDFAKQLLVLLGTLVTAVASFYFGANSVAGAMSAVSKPDATTIRLSAADPRSLPRDGSEKDLKISGDNLAGTTSVTLIKDSDQIAATQVVATEHQITCKIKVEAAKPAGQWDLVVSRPGGQAKLTAYIELT